MKKFFSLLFALSLLLGLAACDFGGGEEAETTTEASTTAGAADPADVHWWGEYVNIINDEYRLSIGSYRGTYFNFEMDNGSFTEEGTAAVDPDDPQSAEFAQYTFYFNLDTEIIDVIGGNFTGQYARVEDTESTTQVAAEISAQDALRLLSQPLDYDFASLKQMETPNGKLWALEDEHGCLCCSDEPEPDVSGSLVYTVILWEYIYTTNADGDDVFDRMIFNNQCYVNAETGEITGDFWTL